MSSALLIDFGSTYTKLRAVDLDDARLIGSGQGPSTVSTDVCDGMHAALADLERQIGALPAFSHRLASSSAAGGLRMVTVGLVRELTAEAARRAALGAGARLVGTFAYRLTAADIAEIEAMAPDILLLVGGTDGGNEAVIRQNADKLADARLVCPIIIAGNRAATDDVAARLEDAGKPVVTAANVMPEFNVLDVEPARDAIRRVFIERIVHAKGIDRAAEMFDRVLMPTPAAVLEGARLIADGTVDTPGIGPLVVVDVGGATTDVHSIADGAPSDDGVVQHGLPEPYAKRSVEGDLGMRHNIAGIVEAVGIDDLAGRANLSHEHADAVLSALAGDVERLPVNDDERRMDGALAAAATRIAMARHAGRLKIVQTVTGPAAMQEGKDLSAVATIIGTGGVLAHGDDPAAILAGALADDSESLRPHSPRLLLDRDYLLYAIGLLAEIAPETALALAGRSFETLETEAGDERISAA